MTRRLEAFSVALKQLVQMQLCLLLTLRQMETDIELQDTVSDLRK